MSRLSILIVHHNRIHYLKAALQSILENTIHPFELLIYDNNSERPDKRFLKRFEETAKAPVKVFYGEKNIGVWQASNILIANASSRETLGFIKMDNDCIVRTKGWETRWMKVAQDIPEVGIVAANAENISRQSKRVTPWDKNGHHLLINNNYGTGVCVYWPARTFKVLGFYEEFFGAMGHCDKSLEVRCRALGQKFVYDENVIVDRQKPGRRDHYGGYRTWKNHYVKNNKPVFLKFKEEYLSGQRSPAIWYEKFAHTIPIECTQQGFVFTDPTPLVDWNSGVPLNVRQNQHTTC
jgi:GT2 family glycosyltransferase